MTDLQKLLAAGILLNSALYLTGVFAAGIAAGNGAAWKLALVSAGLVYVSYFAQYLSGLHPRLGIVAMVATVGSIGAGVQAGVSLLLWS